MANQAAVPRLEEYDVSEKTGFNLEDPENTLPDYFKAWTDIKDDLVELITSKQLRDTVNKMPLLDHTVLTTYKQRRLAHMILTFIGSGYVWQDISRGAAQSVPEQLAVPWCALSELVGLPPVITLSTLSLGNYRILDEQKPLNIDNRVYDALAEFHIASTWALNDGRDRADVLRLTIPALLPDSHFRLCQNHRIELDCLPGIKAILKAMEGVVSRDVHQVTNSLNTMTASLEDVLKSMTRLNETVDPGVFYNTLRPFLSGWGSEGSPIPYGLIYEGASPRQRKLNGGSQAQSTSIQCFDAALGLIHPPDEQAYLNKVRNYMPKQHAMLIEAMWNAPSIRRFAESSSDPKLREAYGGCVKTLFKLRTRHLGLAHRYIVKQVNKNDKSDGRESREERGTGGTGFLEFLTKIRETTKPSNNEQQQETANTMNLARIIVILLCVIGYGLAVHTL